MTIPGGGPLDDLGVDSTKSTRRFTLISAAFNVAEYLRDFIDSIEKQSFDLTRVQVVVVDDGSTDATGELLDQWARRRPELVTVVHQENAGQASARNRGLEIARGEWVGFPDPDDLLDEAYLSNVNVFLDHNPDVELVATNRVVLRSDSGRIAETHPLRHFFEPGDRVVDLDIDGRRFHSSASAGFLRGKLLEGMAFDDRVRPIFEDNHLIDHYLIRAGSRKVGFVKTAHYIYRVRTDGSSTLQNALQDHRRYTNVLRYGYLDILLSARCADGHVPLWVQSNIIHELRSLLRDMIWGSGRGVDLSPQVCEEFHSLMGEITDELDEGVLEDSRWPGSTDLIRDMLLHSWSETPWRSGWAAVTSQDRTSKQVRLVYRFTGQSPREAIHQAEVVTAPAHGKYRAITIAGRTVMSERILWVGYDNRTTLRLDSHLVDFVPGWPARTTTSLSGFQLSRLLDDSPQRPSFRDLLRKARDRGLSTWAGDKYQDSWVLVDRLHAANDNAEHLFQYLRTERSDIDAWFVLEKGTPDWHRLKAAGFGDRLVPYRSWKWRKLMADCAVVISSQADKMILNPPLLKRSRQGECKVVFLQHGVLVTDQSTVLNGYHLDLFMTSTQTELDSVAGNNTLYDYTTKEVRLTGLPRTDELLRSDEKRSVDQRDLILVAPTWRRWLVKLLVGESHRRQVADEFSESDFAKEWGSYLGSERLAELARNAGLRIGVLAHPNLTAGLDELDLPPHVEILSLADEKASDILCRARIFVTDYSSVAFDLAYIDRPMLYFQFDEDRFYGGDHTAAGGYFDTERHGFGPVVHDLEGALQATATLLDSGADPAPVYRQRAASTFAFHDTRSSERVTRAIENALRGK